MSPSATQITVNASKSQVGQVAVSYSPGVVNLKVSVASAVQVLQTKIPGIPGPKGEPGDTENFYTYAMIITTFGQTKFNLVVPPTDLNDVAFLVNGSEYRSPNIAISSTTLTWFGLFPLDPMTDQAFVRYR